MEFQIVNWPKFKSLEVGLTTSTACGSGENQLRGITGVNSLLKNVIMAEEYELQIYHY